MATSSEQALLHTPLYPVHLEAGAKMVPFAGYSMPVQYPAGIVREHLHTRREAGLFDVSHMGQLRLRGAGLTAALERLLPLDLQGLPDDRQLYGLLTNDRGGIRDDLIICRRGDDDFFMVVNAACKAADAAYLRAQLPGFEVEEMLQHALLALQGPRAVHVLATLAPELAALAFMSGMRVSLAQADCYVTRSGYTGEDGFEISVPAAEAATLARILLAFESVEFAGLGARDSLRLEAGLCLYGHDMDETTTPVEAALAWSISAVRRRGGAREGGFPGAATILEQMDSGAPRRRVGLAIAGRAPVREGAELQTPAGEPAGRVCSGGFGPSLQAPVAMAYVAAGHARPGTALQAIVRGRPHDVTVRPLPFVPRRYHRA